MRKMQLAEQVSEDLCFQKSAFRDMNGLAFHPTSLNMFVICVVCTLQILF